MNNKDHERKKNYLKISKKIKKSKDSTAENSKNRIRQIDERKRRRKMQRKFKLTIPYRKSGRWTLEEEEKFIEACIDHGKDWPKVKLIFLF
jgi:hypothetical protein